jgi:hypothetical protein
MSELQQSATPAKLYLMRSREIAGRMLAGEMMIMSARDSALFTLNETASVIWNAADGVTPLDRIVEERVCAEFDVDRTSALRDAEELVAELAKHGILIISDTPIGEAA